MRPACVLVRERGVGNVGRKAGTTFNVGKRRRVAGAPRGRQHSGGLGAVHLPDVAGLRHRAGTAPRKGGARPFVLGVPGARYPATQVRRLWEQLLSETDDPLVGMRCGQECRWRRCTVSDSRRDVALALAGARPRGALRKIISSTMDVSLSHNHEGTTLRLRTLKGTEPGGSASLAMLAFILRQANSLSHHKVTPTAVGVCLPHLPETDRKRLDRHFGVAVDTSAECAHITFAYPDTIEPYASANAILREVTEELRSNTSTACGRRPLLRAPKR